MIFNVILDKLVYLSILHNLCANYWLQLIVPLQVRPGAVAPFSLQVRQSQHQVRPPLQADQDLDLLHGQLLRTRHVMEQLQNVEVDANSAGVPVALVGQAELIGLHEKELQLLLPAVV